MLLNLGKKKTVDQFIYGEGMTPRWFEANFAKYVGPDVEWKFCVHMDNGKEGFLCKVRQQIAPEVITTMRMDCYDARQRSKENAERAYFERLELTWREGNRDFPETRREESWRYNRGGPGSDIPALQVPPPYTLTPDNLPYGDRPQSIGETAWNSETGCWENRNSRFTRSTPATPTTPSAGFWRSRPDSGVGLSPVSSHSSDPTFLGIRCSTRSSGVVSLHDKSMGIRRPRSAADMRTSSTGQMLINMSRGSYGWI
ncbi:uncharacterized protein H6S33_006643 [Morchella sextelata]|uniref:uncharacterized protein n=1 Tax=Morchella sextelata TaxID=1174677 RepID=UPI001D04B13E|nr:uncharacterized protein H6S33_006643 [Morchella sextelata]KAH0604266.1 hypothetical protein H6S33_006643 [Morchella sextelata]